MGDKFEIGKRLQVPVCSIIESTRQVTTVTEE